MNKFNKKTLINMINNRFSVSYNGKEIVGEILELDEYFIKVDIVSPYCNWTNQLKSNGMSRLSPENFLSTYEEVSKRLLLESYRKLQIIDENLERICGVYVMLIEEKNELKQLTDSKIKARIISKLETWFFQNFIFTSSVTNLITSINEEPKIIEIIESYQRNKCKIYLS